MRKVLFRGKRIGNGKWVEGYLVDQENPEYHEYIIESFKAEIDNRHIEIMACYIEEVIPETIGQYTGLTDKNGVKIFEGDILRCASEDWNKSYITKVCAYGNTLCVDIDVEEMSGYNMPIDFADEIWCNESYEIEVIGNIYDNPDLMERR